MKCETCQAPMSERPATPEQPYFYDIGGLPRFPLESDVTIWTCPGCKVESVTIRAPGQLHRRIARVLLSKPTPLTGDELRFIRKHAGFSAQQFADMLSIDPAYLSRIENGKHNHLKTGTERLARLIVAMSEDGAIPNEAVMLPTGTEGPDSPEVQEWKRFVSTVATPSVEWNRKMVPTIWGMKKHFDELRTPAKTRPRPFMADVRSGKKPLKRPVK